MTQHAPIKCRRCDRTFTPKRGYQVFCGRQCAVRFHTHKRSQPSEPKLRCHTEGNRTFDDVGWGQWRNRRTA